MEFPVKTSEYEELQEMKGPMGLCYGPVTSRRLGASLGINFLGTQDKICSYDCPYCELGLTKLKMSHIKKAMAYPSLAEIDGAVRKIVVDFTKSGTKFDTLCVSGNGDPTLHPEFLEAVQLLIKIRDDLVPENKVVVLSNGTTLDESKIIKAMNLFDERMIKLDAGNDEMLKKINAPLVRMNLSRLILGTKKLKDVILQAMFLQGAIDNTIPAEVEEWVEVVGIIKPKLVHLYSLDRVPPVPGLKQVPSQKLKEISQLLLKRTQIKGVVFS